MKEMITIHSGYYLIALDQNNKVVTHDGSHGSYHGVSKALELFKRLGFYKKELNYKMVNIKSEIIIEKTVTGNSSLPDMYRAFEETIQSNPKILKNISEKKMKLNEEAIAYNNMAMDYTKILGNKR